MASNFTYNQGELIRYTLEFTDTTGGFPIPMTVDAGETPLYYFAGAAEFTGTAVAEIPAVPARAANIPDGITAADAIPAYIPSAPQTFSFQFKDAQTLTTGRGSNSETKTEVFKVDAYLSADDTSKMAAGEWNYSVKYADATDPTENRNVDVLLDGVITINKAVTINPDRAQSAFAAPKKADKATQSTRP